MRWENNRLTRREYFFPASETSKKKLIFGEQFFALHFTLTVERARKKRSKLWLLAFCRIWLTISRKKRRKSKLLSTDFYMQYQQFKSTTVKIHAKGKIENNSFLLCLGRYNKLHCNTKKKQTIKSLNSHFSSIHIFNEVNIEL